MPAERRTPGPSDLARFLMPAQNPPERIVDEEHAVESNSLNKMVKLPGCSSLEMPSCI